MVSKMLAEAGSGSTGTRERRNGLLDIAAQPSLSQKSTCTGAGVVGHGRGGQQIDRNKMT